MRNLKVMGLSLIALLAMSAFGASTAFGQFESEAETTTLSVSSSETQSFQVKSGGLTVECETLSLDNATQSGKEATEVTVEPTYSNCANLLGQSTSVVTNGCTYVFHLAKGETTGTTDVSCPEAGIQINIGSICQYEVGSQEGLSSVSYSNLGSEATREVEIEPSVSGITSTRSTNHFFCPAASSEGSYSGSAVVEGTSGGSQVGIFVD